MKIVVLDGQALNPGDLSWQCFEQFGDITVYDRTENAVRRIGDADIVLVNKVPLTAEVIAACPNLKLICCLSTGYNVVDIDFARSRNIPVCNVPAYSTHAVSQFTIALLLELCHRIGHHDRLVHDGAWAAAPFQGGADHQIVLGSRHGGVGKADAANGQGDDQEEHNDLLHGQIGRAHV